MILINLIKSNFFDKRFEKIAKSLIGINLSSTVKSTSKINPIKSIGKNFKTNERPLNLQSTISRSRDKADMQPLHKDTGMAIKPLDEPFSSTMSGNQSRLSNLEDKRITNHKIKNR